ncbi:hypothetical protein [Kribbella endophytica]
MEDGDFPPVRIRGWDGWSEDTQAGLAEELADDVCLFVRDAGPRRWL